MLVRIFLLTLFCLPAYADLLTKADLTYNSEYTSHEARHSLTFQDAADGAIKNSTDLAAIKEKQDDAVQNLSKALNSLMPEIKASASKNTLDRSRPDYIEKAAVKNYNAKIKLKQILFSESMTAEAKMAEYRANAQRLAAESMRLDVIRETSEVYFSISESKALSDSISASVSELKSLRTVLKSNNAGAEDISALDKEIKSAENLLKKQQTELSGSVKKLSQMTGYGLSSGCRYENPAEQQSSKLLTRLIALFKSVKHENQYVKIEDYLTVKAIEDSQELKFLDEIISLSRREVTAEKRRLNLPDVSFSGEYTQYIEKGQKDSEYSPDFNKNDWNLNFKLSMPVFDGKKTSPDLYEKHSGLMDSLHRRAQIKEAVKARMETAVAQTRYAAEQHTKAQQKNISAQKRFGEYKKLYPKKKITSKSVTGALAEKSKAEREEIRALYRLYSGLISLQRAYGKFFAYNGDYEDERFIKELEDAAVNNP